MVKFQQFDYRSIQGFSSRVSWFLKLDCNEKNSGVSYKKNHIGYSILCYCVTSLIDIAHHESINANFEEKPSC